MIFDRLADWETPYALCAITRSEKFEVVTVGFSQQPITTMGGLKLIPEIPLPYVDQDEASIFILPGGEMWERQSDANLQQLLLKLHEAQVPIAAICGGTLEVVRAGLTHKLRHTSNSKQYLKTNVSDYKDEAFYVDQLAVTDQHIITGERHGRD